MCEANPQLFRDFENSDSYVPQGGIRLLTTTTNFNIHPQFTRMVKAEQFCGGSDDEPLDHLDRFLEICAMITTNGVSPDYIKMHLFRSLLPEKQNHGSRAYLLIPLLLGRKSHWPF